MENLTAEQTLEGNSREVKFRAWHTEAKEMLFGEKAYYPFYWKDEGQPVILMQYTGLKDKNGKEIYEGDIGHSNGENYLIALKEIAGAYKAINIRKEDDTHFLLNCNHFIEIVGNIYENPEWLSTPIKTENSPDIYTKD